MGYEQENVIPLTPEAQLHEEYEKLQEELINQNPSSERVQKIKERMAELEVYLGIAA